MCHWREKSERASSGTTDRRWTAPPSSGVGEPGSIGPPDPTLCAPVASGRARSGSGVNDGGRDDMVGTQRFAGQEVGVAEGEGEAVEAEVEAVSEAAGLADFAVSVPLWAVVVSVTVFSAPVPSV